MDIRWEKKAQRQYESLEEPVREAISDELAKMMKHGIACLPDDTVKIIYDDGFGEIFRLKVKEKRGETVDHRVFFDIVDSEFRILRIYHRDTAYQS